MNNVSFQKSSFFNWKNKSMEPNIHMCGSVCVSFNFIHKTFEKSIDAARLYTNLTVIAENMWNSDNY